MPALSGQVGGNKLQESSNLTIKIAVFSQLISLPFSKCNFMTSTMQVLQYKKQVFKTITSLEINVIHIGSKAYFGLSQGFYHKH